MSSIKYLLNEQLSLIAQSLTSPQRLEILEYLSQTERSVDELSQLSNLNIANTSRHLQILKQAALVVVRRAGNKRFYKLAGNDVTNLISSLRNTAKIHLAEVEYLMQSYLNKKDELEAIDAQELLERTKHNEVTILDIRPKEEFNTGHLPNAINIPPDEINERIKNLKKDKEIVAYCRGPYCLFAYDAIEALRGQGFRAKRLENGFPEWKAAGYPIQQSHNLKQGGL
ncbi:ArsR/SmtB family transcription factor [Bathymodiolus septemdierum thioautotrophic gill symbiont]|uniref:ArsR family transcriptional regulator n=1 Tax=endosymbiont of Bathymodiolus septemdierum str. Myojin knoll TaxID=1303921 RepID=A0A0P0USX3_9GAMM|nr:metalloregulator ArsR/SmtB family transcription factor [Bathymodiolus septemdierum thioautotrophic gill symbiont]BAS68366.1 ArsR family transcriptional regulator [endosymbiont of Bathymodiolus septemdierum str. Myojin knoll]